MLRRRRRNLFFLGVCVLVALLAVGLKPLATPARSAADKPAVTAHVADTVQQDRSQPQAGAAPRATPSTFAGQTSCAAEYVACVDLENHTTWIQRAGKVVFGPVTMLPGSKSSPTPPGAYTVQWKDKTHVSGEYGDKMPYAVFFAPGGIAFHEGSLTTSSHGCVHLDATDAAAYFATLSVHDTVKVF